MERSLEKEMDGSTPLLLRREDDTVGASLTPPPPRPMAYRAGPLRPEPPASSGGISARLFAVTALGGFIASLDLSIVNVAFPALQQSFPNSSRSALAWVITAYVIAFASLLVTAGRMADRFGRRRMFFAGIAVFAAGSALTALAPSVLLVVAGRVTQGIGAALLVPSALGLLLAACPPAKRAQTMALWGGATALAVALGPSLGAALIGAAGWRWAFYINLPVAAVAWLAGRRWVSPDPQRPRLGGADYGGVVLISAALAGLVLAISEGPHWGWRDGRVLVAITIAIASGSAFIRRCAHHPQPVVDLRLFRARSFTVANAATVTYAMGFLAMLLGSILFLTEMWHYSTFQAGMAITPAPILVALLSGPAGRLAARVGFRPVIAVGSLLFALGMCWYAVASGSGTSYLTVWLPGLLLVGVGIGLAFPVLGAAAASSLSAQSFAVGSAINQTCRQVGGALGIAILVALLGDGTAGPAALAGFRHLWVYAAVMAALTGAISLLLRPARLSIVPPREDLL
jgi:EmrB/QacA subfamily drug resistance transporter